MRQIVLDTETTGLEPNDHRIIELGCVELIDRRLTGNNFHQYLQPDRKIDDAAVEVHGITSEFLEDKPRFADVMDDFISYVSGAELIIHNAPFDVGFIEKELERAGAEIRRLDALCVITDTLVMARKKHPGKRNSLDALCKRYEIDNSQRTLHGALLDSEILADVYLIMTGGQSALSLGGISDEQGGAGVFEVRRLSANRAPLTVIRADEDECMSHEKRLNALEKSSESDCVWRRIEGENI
ncbi:DNA polymerase III epsilon subunit [hydrothermal vent metagenome]|uniref:DNA polymerase III subunit epsilon n=1 Tax=hydrothermal vent metagenome TaxID=652676 RepID=A0A3B1BC60_9ZZZZ